MAAVSNLFGWMVAGLSASVYFRLVGFNPHLFLMVLLGLLPGVGAGALLSRSISKTWLLRGIGMAAVLMGIRFLWS